MSAPYTQLPTGTYDFKVSINVAPGFDPGELLYDKVYEATVDIAIEARNLWETLAGQNLNKARQRYIKAIALKQNGDNVTVGLDPTDPLPTMLELGVEAFDLKKGFLRNATKVDKAGRRMRVIPLGTEGTQVMRFRTVVEGKYQPPNNWGHPGLKAKNFHEEVIKELSDTIIPKHIDRIIEEINRGS